MSKTKTNIKIKLSKRLQVVFPLVQIVLQVSHRDHHQLTISTSLSLGKNRRHLFADEHIILFTTATATTRNIHLTK